MKVFQIGFNKCGTRSLHLFFKTAGYPVVHCEKGAIAKDLRAAIAEDEIPFQKWPDVVLFTDMEAVAGPAGTLYEGYRHFEYLHKSFPDAKFILNTRNVEDWLFSRLDHNNGKYLANYKRHFGLTRSRDVMARWRDDWNTHHAAVRSYFADHPASLLEFDIGVDSSDKLVDFFRPELDLSEGVWQQVGKTGAGVPKEMRASARTKA